MRLVPVLLLAFPASLGAQTVSDVDLDHVILAARRLPHGMEAFARLTGVQPKPGGQHPGRGTQNALVSLGGGHYLEILSPITPPPDSVKGPVELTPFGWALHTADLDGVLARLRAAGFQPSGPTPGSRLTPDSTLLQWRTAAVAGPGLELAPFFIEWSKTTAHPSTTSPGGCKLAALELSVPDPARLRAFFAAAGYHIDVKTGSPDALRLTLDCPKGRVTFPPG
jgi:hypothetical protein